MKKLFLAAAIIFAALLASCTYTPDLPELMLEADKFEILADGKDSLTFSVKSGSDDVTSSSSVISIDEEGRVLEGKTFSTAIPGKYHFKAVNGSRESSVIEVNALPVPAKPQPVLRRDKETIYADGMDTVTFTVEVYGKPVSNAAIISIDEGERELPDHSWTSEKSGTYRFRASLDGVDSAIVSVIVEQIPAITIEASNSAIAADGKDSVSFRVFRDGTELLSDWTIVNVTGGTQLEGKEFSTDIPGSYSFKAVVDKWESSSITVKAEPVTPPMDKLPRLELSIDGDRGWINADGTDSVSFTLTADGEALSSGYTLWYSYYDEPFYELTGNTFSTVRGGAHYSFMASCGGAWSNKVSVFVPGAEPDMPELRIELSASSVVKGDAVPLKVYENGRDVTSSSEIYIAGLPVPEKLDGNVFLSTEPGVYGIYARKDGRVSDTIPLSVLSGASGTRTVFAEGVTAESGWHDVNKRPASRSSNEFLMCYAATASNLIEWWQTEWQKLGLTLPSGARTGAGTTPYGDEGHKFELAVFEEYYEGWNPNVGSQIEYALEWYFEGLHKGPYFPEDQGQPFDPVSGAHYLENEETFRKHQGWGYINLYPGSGRSGLSWEGRTGDEQKLIFSSVIRNAIDNGIAGLNINPSGASNVHAISLWGYEVDEATGIVTAIWVTDSDSYLTSPSDVKMEEKMERCPVVYENGGRVSFMRPSIGKSPIVSVVALSSPHA